MYKAAIAFLISIGLFSFEFTQAAPLHVFIANDPVSHRPELFADLTPIGGTVIKLNGPLVSGGHVLNFKVSEDGLRVIYSADARYFSMYEIFSVAVTGGTVLRVNHDLPPDHDVYDYSISPDGATVVYRWGRTAIGTSTLYAMPAVFPPPPMGRPAPIHLSIPMTLGGGVVSYSISCDSRYVFYIADAFIDEDFENFYVQTNGDGHIHLPPGGHWPGEFCVFKDGFNTGNSERWH